MKRWWGDERAVDFDPPIIPRQRTGTAVLAGTAASLAAKRAPRDRAPGVQDRLHEVEDNLALKQFTSESVSAGSPAKMCHQIPHACLLHPPDSVDELKR